MTVLDFILWGAGTVMAIVVFVGIVWPWLLGIWYGACWADARTDLREFGHEIESKIRSSNQNQYLDYRLSLGDCIAGVIFIDGEEERDEWSGVLGAECSEYSGFKSYMIAVAKEYILVQDDPSFIEKFKKQIDELKKKLSVWEAVKLWIKDKMGRVPSSYCYEFDHSFTSDSIKSIPKGFSITDSKVWNNGTAPYCVRVAPRGISNEPGAYNYHMTLIPCPARELTEEEQKEAFQGGDAGGGGASGPISPR
jgi:hypothetical protein